MRLSITFLIAILLISVNSLHAQFPRVIGIDTTQSLGNFDYIFGLTSTPNGSIWMAGRCERTLTPSGGQVSNYGTLVQLSPFGTITTAQRSGFRSMNAIVKSSDNNLIIGGEGSGFICTSGMCKSDMLVAKVATNYALLWGRSFGNPNYNGSDGIKRVFETADSNVVVVGNIYESSSNSHPFIAKLNGANGDTIWTRALGYPSNQFGSDASESPNGDLYLGVSGDLRIHKLSSSGNLLWSKGFAAFGEVRRVFAQADGSVIAIGHYLATFGDYNACMFKVSSAGILEWFYSYNSTTPDINMFINDVIFENGNFYIGGLYYSTATFVGFFPVLIKIDNLGSVAWALTYPSPVGEIKTLHPYNGSILCGMDYSNGAVNNRPDIMIMSVDTTGSTATNCLVPYTMSTTSPTITSMTSASWYYTDFETQVTSIGFAYQSYWSNPGCISTPIESVSSEQLYSVIQQNGQLIISPSLLNSYSIEIFDATGRRLFYDEKAAGEMTVNLTSFSHQLVWVRMMQEEKSYLKKVFVE